MKNINRTIEHIRRKLIARLDENEPEKWVTINGNHIPIDENGEPMGGQPKAYGEGAEAPERLERPNKNKINQAIKEYSDEYFADGKSDEAWGRFIDKVAKELDSLEDGSVITVPESDAYEHEIWVKDGDRWRMKGENFYLLSEDIATYFGDFKDDDGRPYVSKSAESESEKMKRAANRMLNDIAKDWREQPSKWGGDTDFSKTDTVTLTKRDVLSAGLGTKVISKNGDELECNGDGNWYNNTQRHYAEKRDVIGAQATGDFFDINLGLNGMNSERVQEFKTAYNSLPDEIKGVYEKAFKEHPISRAEPGSGAFYSPRMGNVFLDEDTEVDTVFHEMAHAFDYGAVNLKYKYPWGDGTYNVNSASVNIDHLCGSMSDRDNDFEAMAKVVGFKTNGEGWYANGESENAVHTFLKWAGERHVLEGFDSVSDAISALTLDTCGASICYGGHSSEYWRSPYGGNTASSRATEYWANYCSLRCMGRTEALDLLKQITPNMYAAAEETFREVFKK